MKKMFTLFLLTLCFISRAQTVNEVPVKSGYALGSAFLNGFNAAMMLVNLSHHASKAKAAPIVGMLTGTAGIIIGLTNIEKDNIQLIPGGGSIKHSYKKQNNLSYLNIGMGTATFVTSCINALINSNPRKTAFNIYSGPGINNSMNVGLALTRRL